MTDYQLKAITDSQANATPLLGRLFTDNYTEDTAQLVLEILSITRYAEHAYAVNYCYSLREQGVCLSQTAPFVSKGACHLDQSTMMMKPETALIQELTAVGGMVTATNGLALTQLTRYLAADKLANVFTDEIESLKPLQRHESTLSGFGDNVVVSAEHVAISDFLSVSEGDGHPVDEIDVVAAVTGRLSISYEGTLPSVDYGNKVMVYSFDNDFIPHQDIEVDIKIDLEAHFTFNKRTGEHDRLSLHYGVTGSDSEREKANKEINGFFDRGLLPFLADYGLDEAIVKLSPRLKDVEAVQEMTLKREVNTLQQLQYVRAVSDGPMLPLDVAINLTRPEEAVCLKECCQPDIAVLSKLARTLVDMDPNSNQQQLAIRPKM